MSLSLGRLFRRVRTRFHVDYNFKDILNRFVKKITEDTFDTPFVTHRILRISTSYRQNKSEILLYL